MLNKRMIEIIKRCKFCGDEFSAKWYAQKKKYLDFCSRSCIDNWQRRNQLDYKCTFCGKKFKHRRKGRKFCTEDCYFRFKQRPPVQKMAEGFEYKVHNNITKYQGKKCCSLCGYNKYPGVLEIHHINENRGHNTLENLLCVCPNCHSEIHYKKGTGNFWQRKIG